MTKVSGTSETSAPAGTSGMQQETDAVSKDILRQIANAQKQLQELAANEEMSPEQKRKKRQEIQQQIVELNNELAQHKIEQRKKKQQEMAAAAEEAAGGKAQTKTEKTKEAQNGGQNAVLTQTSVKALISADSAMKLAQVQGSVASEMKGRAAVLKMEIKQDGGRGGSSQMKQEELAEAEKIAANAQTSQMSILTKAGKEVEEAAKEDQADETEQTKQEKTKQDKAKQETASANETGIKTQPSEADAYRRIDIRL